MADYDLYYWPAPFRGEFIRAILAFAGKDWDEHTSGEIGALMDEAPADQPAPFMGPPVLIDRKAKLALAQMPAIALYLGETLRLVEDKPAARAMTAKVVNDANDVIDELTLDGGRLMWTEARWNDFVPRLDKWMRIFEATGTRNGLEEDSGHLLGTKQPGIADIVASTLWSRMAERFPPLRDMLEKTAPNTAALTKRLQATPALAALRQRSFEQYGETYCGGQIETSLRKVLSGAD